MKPRQLTVIEPTFQVPPYRFDVLKMTYTDSEGRTIGKQMSPPIDQIEIPEGGCLLEFQTAGGKNVEQPIEIVTNSTPTTEGEEVEEVEEVEQEDEDEEQVEQDKCEDCPEGDCEDCPVDKWDCPEGNCNPEDNSAECEDCDDAECKDCDDAE